jgi:hypothetical protein
MDLDKLTAKLTLCCALGRSLSCWSIYSANPRQNSRLTCLTFQIFFLNFITLSNESIRVLSNRNDLYKLLLLLFSTCLKLSSKIQLYWKFPQLVRSLDF